MASPNRCSPPPPAKNDSADGDMPLDVFWEVLLRLSAKDLCRLRVVCRLWRSITSNRAFIAAHAAHHPGPLLVGSAMSSTKTLDIHVIDLCGNVVKRIHNMSTYNLLQTRLDLVCITKMSRWKINVVKQVDVLNPATGAVHTLPMNLAVKYPDARPFSDLIASYTFGQVATGEYKVLRVLTGDMRACPEQEQIVEVLTLSASSPMQWRAKKAPSTWLSMGDFKRVVVKGVAYFLLDKLFYGGVERVCLALFDLKTEEWILSYLKGPTSSHPELNDMNNMLNPGETELSIHLAELNGFLVVAQQKKFSSSSYLDLWCLMDLEKCLWERKYRIPLGNIVQDCTLVVPYSLTLQDGRILIILRELIRTAAGPHMSSLMRIFDPETNILGPVMTNVGNFYSLSIYAGSLLSVRNDDELQL